MECDIDDVDAARREGKQIDGEEEFPLLGFFLVSLTMALGWNVVDGRSVDGSDGPSPRDDRVLAA